MIKFVCLIGAYLLTTPLASQNINGRIIDEQSQPIPFANVVLLNATDSVFIEGTVTKDDGSFCFITDKEYGILKVSHVGYISRFINVRQKNLGNIQMQLDTLIMNEVFVRGHMPSHRLTSEGVKTNVDNTVLSKLGTGNDVLIHVPGIIQKGESLEVFGKGTPLIYINGRQLRNSAELEQLKSDDIKSIELITNPGAKYDASVRSVVKIHTKPIKGEGFGFNVRSTYGQWENTDLTEQLSWNYRHNRFDMFGTFYYSLDNTNYQNNTYTIAKTDTLWEQSFMQNNSIRRQTCRSIVGANYSFIDKSSIGLRYTLTLRPNKISNPTSVGFITANSEEFDNLTNRVNGLTSYRPSHLLNIYYNGKIGTGKIDFDIDYLYDCEHGFTSNNEISTSQDSRIVNAENIKDNKLLASKLAVKLPLIGGDITFGTEYTHTNRKDDYINPEHYVPTSFSVLKESHIAPFVEYNRNILGCSLTAGLRYELVGFDYYENGHWLDEQSRSFSNLFPSFSLTTQLGNVQLQFGYTAETFRPSYQQLSNNVTYGNRFLLQTGNPFLSHEFIHDVSLVCIWNFLQLSVGYNDRRHAIIYWAEQQENNTSVSRISYANIPSLKNFTAQIVVAPKIGIWSPEFNAEMQKQWLTLRTNDCSYRLNSPLFQFSLYNAFDFGHSWVASADMLLSTKGHSENFYSTRNSSSINVSITKSFMKNCLSIRLQFTDILHMDKSGMIMYVDRIETRQFSKRDSRQLLLTLSYKFNQSKTRYKGSGAGNSEKKRL